MNVGAVLVADLQAPEAVEPGEGAFNHPAVAAQSVLGLDAATGNARNDAPLAQTLLIFMADLGSPPRPVSSEGPTTLASQDSRPRPE
jgi:hypothetical protein